MSIAGRLKECVAMLMIGDGVLGMMDPRRHLPLRSDGPAPWRSMFEPFEKRPALTRSIGFWEIALRVWRASSRWDSRSQD